MLAEGRPVISSLRWHWTRVAPERTRAIHVTCLGTERGLETRLVPMRGYPLGASPAVPLPRSVSPQLLTVPGRLAGAVHTAAAAIDRTRADVLVGFGGYVATPAYLAARRHKVPIVVHEANPYPGIANRLGARFTTHVFTGHPDTKLRRQVPGPADQAADRRPRQVRARRQGARALRAAARPARAAGLRRVAGRAVAQRGGVGRRRMPPRAPGCSSCTSSAHERPEVPVTSSGVPYVAVTYVDRMDLAYAAADFALCRAGAITCAELTAVGLPAAYVPLPIGNGEQRLNALPIVPRGGGMLVTDADLTGEWIRDHAAAGTDRYRPGGRDVRGGADRWPRRRGRWLAEAVIKVLSGNPRRPDNLLTPADPVPLGPARPGPLRRHRRCGHVGDRPHHAGQGHRGFRQRLGRVRRPRGTRRAGRPGAHGPRGRAVRRRGHGGCVERHQGQPTRNLQEARRRGLRVLHRAAALASLMSGRRVIAVTGTHGKTTTTSKSRLDLHQWDRHDGTLPSTVSIHNDNAEYLEGITFGTGISFLFQFSGPLVDSPSGTGSGSTFTFSLLNPTQDGAFLTSDQNDGFLFTFDIDNRGGIHPATFTTDTGAPSVVTISQVPEPGTWMLGGLGVTFLGLLRRRFR